MCICRQHGRSNRHLLFGVELVSQNRRRKAFAGHVDAQRGGHHAVRHHKILVVGLASIVGGRHRQAGPAGLSGQHSGLTCEPVPALDKFALRDCWLISQPCFTHQLRQRHVQRMRDLAQRKHCDIVIPAFNPAEIAPVCACTTIVEASQPSLNFA